MKAFKIACIVYCLLYLIMTFVGTRQIERAMTRDFLAWKASRDPWDPGYPTFYVHAESTPLVFILKVHHGSQIAALAGAGHVSSYFWFFGFRFELTRRTIWVS